MNNSASATKTKSRATARAAASDRPDDQILAAWDLYADAAWSDLAGLDDSGSADIADLIALARYEATDGVFDPGPAKNPTGLFGSLRAGMRACYEHDYARAADLLGRWLLEKEYYSAGVLQRFRDAALIAEAYALLGQVSKKFLGKPAFQKAAVEGFFLAQFHQDRHKEALLIFEKFREQFDDAILLQKAALSMMRVDRYQDAEALLAPLYTRLTGAQYQMRYDEIRADYSDAINNRAALAKKSNRTFEESMQLGMAYLFSSEYDRAMQVFQALMKSQAA